MYTRYSAQSYWVERASVHCNTCTASVGLLFDNTDIIAIWCCMHFCTSDVISWVLHLYMPMVESLHFLKNIFWGVFHLWIHAIFAQNMHYLWAALGKDVNLAYKFVTCLHMHDVDVLRPCYTTRSVKCTQQTCNLVPAILSILKMMVVMKWICRKFQPITPSKCYFSSVQTCFT